MYGSDKFWFLMLFSHSDYYYKPIQDEFSGKIIT
jgi:hypothetical protein